MAIIILDADFLSSFLKIGRLSLVSGFYANSKVLITPAVYREVALTPLLGSLLAITWLQMRAPQLEKLQHLQTEREFQTLGSGEQESIALALENADSVLLTSDNKARQIARRLGATAINLPAFLLLCKQTGQLDREQLQAIVNDLRAKDFYEFRRDVLNLLLA